MIKKKVTLSFDPKTYDSFKKFCDKNAIQLSRKVEIWIEEFLKENGGKLP